MLERTRAKKARMRGGLNIIGRCVFANAMWLLLLVVGVAKVLTGLGLIFRSMEITRSMETLRESWR